MKLIKISVQKILNEYIQKNSLFKFDQKNPID